MTERLHAVGEETLLILVNQYEEGDAHDQRRLLIIAASDGLTAELEFATAPGDAENLEDRIALLKQAGPGNARIGNRARYPSPFAATLRIIREPPAVSRYRGYNSSRRARLNGVGVVDLEPPNKRRRQRLSGSHWRAGGR